MAHLVNERKVLLAVCFIGLGVLILSQTKLFAAPVVVSEKGLGLLLLVVVLLVSGFVLFAKAIRKV